METPAMKVVKELPPIASRLINRIADEAITTPK